MDKERTRSLWYWVKREGTKRYFRDHLYVKGQPGDLFLGKLGSLVIDIADLEESEPSVIEIAQKLQSGFDIERVTKKFYQEFQEEHQIFLQFIRGIDNEIDRRWYTSVILNRLMFVYFLQRKGFIDNGDLDYLQNKLNQSQQRGEDRFFSEFLQMLFFECFAKPETERQPEVQRLIGRVKYLNGGLFLKHRIEENYPNIAISDRGFEQILALFSRYSWHLDDTPGGKDDEINPDVLGYIFEKYINQKAFGAYYTRPEITEYLCDRTINKLILDRVNATIEDPPLPPLKRGENLEQVLKRGENSIKVPLFSSAAARQRGDLGGSPDLKTHHRGGKFQDINELLTHKHAEPKYCLDEHEARKALLGRNGIDNGQNLDYQNYRLGFRDVANATNIRTMIANIVIRICLYSHYIPHSTRTSKTRSTQGLSRC